MERQLKSRGIEQFSPNIVRIPLNPFLLKSNLNLVIGSNTGVSDSVVQPRQPEMAVGIGKTEVNIKISQRKRHRKQGKGNDKRYGRWTKEEHEKVLRAIDLYGNDWTKVGQCVTTRTSHQIRSHLQKHFLRLRKEKIMELKKEGTLKTNIFVVTREYRNHNVAAKRKSKVRPSEQFNLPECSYETPSAAQEKTQKALTQSTDCLASLSSESCNDLLISKCIFLDHEEQSHLELDHSIAESERKLSLNIYDGVLKEYELGREEEWNINWLS